MQEWLTSPRRRETWQRWRARRWRSSARASPRPPRRLDHQLQLAALLVPGQQVAERRRGEAALRRDRQVLERHVLRRLVDAPPQRVDRLELRLLGADQAEHDHLVLRGTKRSGSKPPARSVSYSSRKRSTFELPERLLGDRLVAALGVPGAAVVAAAHVQADRDAAAAAPASDGVVDGDQLVEVGAPGPRRRRSCAHESCCRRRARRSAASRAGCRRTPSACSASISPLQHAARGRAPGPCASGTRGR